MLPRHPLVLAIRPVAEALGDRLWGVRLDTSETLVDRSLWEEMGDFKPTGVNERLVRKTREALDAAGFGHVRIVVSGGFTVEKIRAFEERRKIGIGHFIDEETMRKASSKDVSPRGPSARA